MSRIYINTNTSAPGCPCEIVSDTGKSVLVQTDWDYPGFASSFGWSVQRVQRCKECGRINNSVDDAADSWECGDCGAVNKPCEHSATDGTVNCRDCGIEAGAFISAAGDYLTDNHGAAAEDPGYFG